MTKEELQALPVFEDYEITVLPGGEAVRTLKIPSFRQYRPRPDDIFSFTDKDGIIWFVDYHLEGGPYKRAMEQEFSEL